MILLDCFLKIRILDFWGKDSFQDELMMREYLREGDLLSAEIHEIRNDGTVNLHTRSLKYGKLAQGILVVVRNLWIFGKNIGFFL